MWGILRISVDNEINRWMTVKHKCGIDSHAEPDWLPPLWHGTRLTTTIMAWYQTDYHHYGMVPDWLPPLWHGTRLATTTWHGTRLTITIMAWHQTDYHHYGMVPDRLPPLWHGTRLTTTIMAWYQTDYHHYGMVPRLSHLLVRPAHWKMLVGWTSVNDSILVFYSCIYAIGSTPVYNEIAGKARITRCLDDTRYLWY